VLYPLPGRFFSIGKDAEGGHAVLIAADRDHALLADPPLHSQNRFIRMRWQSQKMRCLLGKIIIHDSLGSCMPPRVGDGRAPLLELGIQILCACLPAGVSKRRSNCRGTGGRIIRRYSLRVE